MARSLRIDLPDGIYHVTSRGLERPVIARDDLLNSGYATGLNRRRGRIGPPFQGRFKGVAVDTLTVRGRRGNGARDVAVWLTRALTRASIDDLGAHYGGVSGSAVSHIVRRVDRRRAESPPFCKQLGKLERQTRHDSRFKA